MNYSFDTSDIEGGADGPRRYRSVPGNLVQTLRRAVDRNPAGEALVEIGGDRVTYTQLWDRAARVAGGLREAGVQPGDRVALRLPNGTDWALAFWGTVLAGAVVVPVNLRFIPEEVAYVVDWTPAPGTSSSPGSRSRTAGRWPSRIKGATISPSSSTPAARRGSPRAP